MASYSSTTIVGHLGKDPEMRTTQNGQQVANFSVAVSHKVGDTEHTIWYNVACWGKLAETAEKYLRKGNPVMVNGQLSIREYTNRDGQKGFSVDVTCRDLVLIEKRQDSESGGGQQQAAPQPQPAPHLQKPQQEEWQVADETDMPF